MPIYYHKSIALFLSIIIAFESIAGGGEFWMSYDMLFDRNYMFNHTKKNTSYNTWYYNIELYNDSNLKNQNAQSWSDFLEGAYRKADLIKFIYRKETKFSTRENELMALRNKRLEPLNSLQKETQFVDCIIFALKVEKLLASCATDPWKDKPRKIVLSDFNPLINQALSQININTDQFLKQRYAFQLLKLCRYSKQNNAFVLHYKKYFESTNSMLSYWAMEHYAGVLADMGKTAEANYYFAKVYVNCSEKRRSSYLSMKLESTTYFNQTLNFCVNDEEKMALYYIHAMQTKSLALSDLQLITKNLGNHEYARVIMSHEINKLEQILLVHNERYPSDHTKSLQLLKDQVPNYLKELIHFNEGLLEKDQDDRFWHLSLSYLFYLDGQHQACSKLLERVNPNSPEIQKQYDIIFIINYLENKDSLSIIDENIIGKKLYSLNNNNADFHYRCEVRNSDGGYGSEEYNTINEFIFRKIYERYQYTNSFLKLIFSAGGYFNDLCIRSTTPIENKKGFEVQVSDIDRIIEDLHHTPETKLALFASTYYFGITTYRECEQKLKELKATILLRDPSKISDALEIYESLPKEMVNNYYVHGSPFTYSSKTPNFSHHDEIQDQLPKMTRLAFAQKIKLLLSEPLTAETAFQLGLAYYNCSYYGLQWNMFAYYRSYDWPINNGNVDMHFAKNYFKTALSIGGLSREKEAQIYFMLARCEQNSYSITNGVIPHGDKYGFTDYFNQMRRVNSMQNFQKLASNYYSTKTYQEIIRECKYFEYYIN